MPADAIAVEAPAQAGVADPVEVCGEMAFEQAQHHSVAGINGSASDWNSTIVLALDPLSQQIPAAGAAAVARCHKQAGITDAVSLGAVGD